LVLADDVVHHTYSAYARGMGALRGMFPWLDRAPRDATRNPGVRTGVLLAVHPTLP